MTSADAPSVELTITVDADRTVSALLDGPRDARMAYVFAHGAGAGMRHASMTAFATGLARQGMAVLRYQFPYMEQGGRRPDPPRIAHAAVRAAVASARTLLPSAALYAGGRSFGGRMTSQAQAAAPLPEVRGLVFLGFPLHPAGRPGTDRADHLRAVTLPMLFMQGDRDELAELGLLRPVVAALGARASLELIDDADHSFHVRARSGRNDAQVRDAMIETMIRWCAAQSAG